MLRDRRRRRRVRLRRRRRTRRLRETVRERYAAAARAHRPRGRGCCGGGAAITDEQAELFGAGLYADDERDELPDTALLASLGCGNPTAMADLHAGETVLDLGSGGGIDVLLSARRVGPTGTAYGLDMTDEMLDLARANQAKAGVDERPLAQGPHRSHPAPRRDASTSSSPTASSTSPPTSRGPARSRPRPQARRPLRRLRRRSPTPTWTTPPAPTSRSTSAASPARSRARSTRASSPTPA